MSSCKCWNTICLYWAGRTNWCRCSVLLYNNPPSRCSLDHSCISFFTAPLALCLMSLVMLELDSFILIISHITGSSLCAFRSSSWLNFPKTSPASLSSRACERSWAVRIPAPRSRGCLLPRSTAQSYTRPLRSIPLPAHLQFHPAPVKSLHARSNLKFLTPAVFNRSLTPWTHCLRDGRGAGLLRNCCGKIRFTSILSRGCGVVGPRTWYAHIPQAVWLLQGRRQRTQARPLWWKAPPVYYTNIIFVK